MSKDIDTIVNKLAGKRSDANLLAKPKPEPKPKHAFPEHSSAQRNARPTTTPSNWSYSGANRTTSSVVRPKVTWSTGLTPDKVAELGETKKKPKPRRQPYDQFPAAPNALDFRKLEAEPVSRNDTFESWLERAGYGDLHPEHDDSCYTMAARMYLRMKAAAHKR